MFCRGAGAACAIPSNPRVSCKEQLKCTVTVQQVQSSRGRAGPSRGPVQAWLGQAGSTNQSCSLPSPRPAPGRGWTCPAALLPAIKHLITAAHSDIFQGINLLLPGLYQMYPYQWMYHIIMVCVCMCVCHASTRAVINVTRSSAGWARLGLSYVTVSHTESGHQQAPARLHLTLATDTNYHVQET